MCPGVTASTPQLLTGLHCTVLPWLNYSNALSLSLSRSVSTLYCQPCIMGSNNNSNTTSTHHTGRVTLSICKPKYHRSILSCNKESTGWTGPRNCWKMKITLLYKLLHCTAQHNTAHLRVLNPIANIRNVGPWPKHTCELKLYLGKAIQYPIHYYSARHWCGMLEPVWPSNNNVHYVDRSEYIASLCTFLLTRKNVVSSR